MLIWALVYLFMYFWKRTDAAWMFPMWQIKHTLESTPEPKVNLSQQASQQQTAPWFPNFSNESL